MADQPQGLYDSPTRCTGGPTQGALALRDTILGRFAGTTDSGIYNCRSTRTGSGLSEHAEGRANDIGVKSIAVGNAVATWAERYATQLGVQSIIWNDRVWTSTRPTWRAYHDPATGRPFTDPTLGHRDHVHIGLTRAAGAGLTTGTLAGLKGGSGPLGAVGGTVAGFGGDLVGSAVQPLIDGLRRITLMGAFLVGGSALIAAGAYRAVTGRPVTQRAAEGAQGAGRLALQAGEAVATGGAGTAARAGKAATTTKTAKTAKTARRATA